MHLYRLFANACLVFAGVAAVAAPLPPGNTPPPLGPNDLYIIEFPQMAVELPPVTVTARKGGWLTVCRGSEECEQYLGSLQPNISEVELSKVGFDPIEIAKLDKQQDVRCVPFISEQSRNTKSTDEADARKAATQEAFDKTFQRNKIASSTWQIVVFGVKTKVGLNSSYTFTMTFADGGKEDFVVQNITASQNITAKDGTLKVGSGQVEPKACAAG